MATCHAGARVNARARVRDDLAFANRGGGLARPGVSVIEPVMPRANTGAGDRPDQTISLTMVQSVVPSSFANPLAPGAVLQHDSIAVSATATAMAPAFETTILPHLNAAYDLALWLTRDSVEAEDTVQDACVRALRYFCSFRGESGRAWLLKIVRNTAYVRLRSRNTVAEVAYGNFGSEFDDGGIGLDLADPNPGPEATLSNAQEFAQLRAVMSELPIDLRECLILREMRELTYKEIAWITDVSIGTVMSRLYRARRLLMASWSRPDLSTVTALL
jgi:RNA polymerase sigma factor (sigma-70 family)